MSEEIGHDWDEALRELTGQMGEADSHARSVALVMTPLASVEAVAAVLAMSSLPGQVLMTDTGAAVWLEVEPDPEDDLNALLGADRPMPKKADELAKLLSQTSPLGVVLLVSWLGNGDQGEPGVSGQVIARRYQKGAEGADLPAGLVISTADGRVEDLLLGKSTPADYENIDASRMGRMAGLKALRKAMRRKKKGE